MHKYLVKSLKTKESRLEMALAENLRPLTAPHQQFLSSVGTVTAFVILSASALHSNPPHFLSFTPKQQLIFVYPNLKLPLNSLFSANSGYKRYI